MAASMSKAVLDNFLQRFALITWPYCTLATCNEDVTYRRDPIAKSDFATLIHVRDQSTTKSPSSRRLINVTYGMLDGAKKHGRKFAGFEDT